jgi:tetratricopeptide (TPR) repeat protein
MARFPEAMSTAILRKVELAGSDPALSGAAICAACLFNLLQICSSLESALQHAESDSQRALAWQNLASTHAGLHQYDEARMLYTHALTLDPSNAFAWCNRSECLTHLERFDEALADADHGLEVSSGHPHLLVSKGLALTKLRRFSEARADLGRALSIWQDIEGMWFAIAQLELAEGHRHAALVAIDKSLALHRDKQALAAQRRLAELDARTAAMAAQIPTFSPWPPEARHQGSALDT